MDKRDSIVKIITSPLGFFALSLLILEGFLTIVVVGSGSSLLETSKVLGMWMATLSFAGIIIIVSLMVWLIPTNLTYKSDDWREQAKDDISWGSNKRPSTKSKITEESKQKA